MIGIIDNVAIGLPKFTYMTVEVGCQKEAG